MIVSPNDRIHGFLKEVHENPYQIVLTERQFAGSWLRMDATANTIVEDWSKSDVNRSGIMRCVRKDMLADFRVVVQNELTAHGQRALEALNNGFVWLTNPGVKCQARTDSLWQGILNCPTISDENFKRALDLKAPELKDIRNAFVQRKLRSVRGANNMWVVEND